MKSFAVYIIVAVAGIGIFALIFTHFNSAEAQNKTSVQWEYAAVTNTFVPYQVERQAVITGTANICYLRANGCQNEEASVELVYTKFLQEMRLEDTNPSKNAAYNRARELAFSKAVAKLGLDGWEMIGQPSFEFDNYVPNFDGGFNVTQNEKSVTPDVYFKRLK